MDLRWSRRNRIDRSLRRCPSSYLENYVSPGYSQVTDRTDSAAFNWVTCRFSPSRDHILFLGDDYGRIGLIDVRDMYTPGCQLGNILAHVGCVMDVVGVPHTDHELISIGGDANVRVWDLNTEKSTLFYGHSKSVLAVACDPDNPSLFVTGGRDGHLKFWDRRMKLEEVKGLAEPCGLPEFDIMDCHLISMISEKVASNPGTPTSKKKAVRKKPVSAFVQDDAPHLTSIAYLDSNTVISATAKSKSGIRFWDRRYIIPHKETSTYSTRRCVRSLEIPTSTLKETGVTSITLDRFGTSLFALVTDKLVYEYAISTCNDKPVRILSGANIDSYFTRIQASPISDHVLCSSRNQAIIWDLQANHRYANEFDIPTCSDRSRSLLPSYTLNGHDTEISTVGWSLKGTYMITMDHNAMRLWDSTEPKENTSTQLGVVEEYGTREQPQRYELTETEKTIAMVERVEFVRRAQPVRLYSSPKKVTVLPPSLRNPIGNGKRKLAFTSPLKQCSTNQKSPFKMCTPSKSPKAKYMKLSPPVLPQPLSDSTNLPSATKKRSTPTKPKNAFHARFPTYNLPNSIYDKYMMKLYGDNNALFDDKSGKRRLDGWLRSSPQSATKGTARLSRISTSEMGEAVCSKMLSEQDREILNSPCKLTVKRTPLKTPVSRFKVHEVDSSPTVESPGSATRRRTSRNLLHYFSPRNQQPTIAE